MPDANHTCPRLVVLELALAGTAWLWGTLLECLPALSTFLAELMEELAEDFRCFVRGVCFPLSVAIMVSLLVLFISLGYNVFDECRQSWRGLAANKESLRVSIGHFEETCISLAMEIERKNSATRTLFDELNDLINAIQIRYPGNKKVTVPLYARRLAVDWAGHSPARLRALFRANPGFTALVWNGLDEDFLSMLDEQDRLRTLVRMNRISKYPPATALHLARPRACQLASGGSLERHRIGATLTLGICSPRQVGY